MTGLSFELTAEQEQLRQMVRDFADRECPKDVARRLEAPRDFPEELARRIAKAGLNGIGVPEEYGGQGGDLIDQTIVCEELSRTLGGLAWLWGITVWSGGAGLLHHGNAAQKERYLPAVASGDLRFAARQDREAAVFPGARASVADLSALSASYARALVSLGAGPGDHVGALLPAGLEVVP